MEDLFNSDKVVGLGRRPSSVSGDNDVGPVVGLVERPTFCAGSTDDEIRRAFEGDESVFVFDLERQKDASNPVQCETARLYDLRTNRWYRESPASLLKNLGAGVVNAVVPGSDLGDARSSTQILGQLIGSVAGLFVNPSQAVTKLTNSMGLGTTLSNAFNFVNKTISGPLGSIATGYVGSLLSPKPVPAPVQAQIFSSSMPAQIAEPVLSYAQSKIFSGGSGGVMVGGTKVTLGEDPWYKNPWIIVSGIVAVLVTLYLVFKRKKR